MDRGLSRTEVTLTSICILATSVTAGSIFCFPIFGPSLTRDLGLSLTQTNTIWSGAVLGEYISAAFWGALADRFGPNLLCSFAAFLFGGGYLLMSHADATAIKMLETGQDLTVLQSWHSPSGFVAMSAYFVLVGAGVAASYFSAVIASTRLFPSTPGLAISVPLTLFSLSSLFLSWIGTQFFVDPETGELNTASFLTFLGILLFCVNMISALAMRIGDSPESTTITTPLPEDALVGDGDLESRQSEETPLLINSSTPSNSGLPGTPLTPSLASLLKAPSFLALSLLLFVAVGGSEMVMSSIGAMAVSLLGNLGGKDQMSSFIGETLRRGVLMSLGSVSEIDPSSDSDSDSGPRLGGEALRIRSAQVSLLALANTLARLIAGISSDLLSPNPLKRSVEHQGQINRNHNFMVQIKTFLTNGKVPEGISLSRMSLILFAMMILLVAFVFSAFALTSTDQLAIISVFTGVGYGLIFALVPSIMATAYGLAQFGRNWGVASYACAAGSLSYSLLYATISDYVASKHPITMLEPDEEESGGLGICYGSECFQASFLVASIGLLIAFLPIFQLWRKWRWFL